MLQKITENLKLYIIVVVSFFTFCAGLYHFAYWQVFGINGIAIVSISDFIKSFVYPGCTLLLFGAFIYLYFWAVPKVVSVKKTTGVGLAYSSFNMLIPLLLFVSYSYFLYKNDSRQWLFLPIIFGNFFYIAVSNSKIAEKFIANMQLRQYIIYMLTCLPFTSFGLGRYAAENIFNCKKYDYCINYSANNDTLKYLGRSNEYFILTSIDNSKNYFINANKIDTIVFLHSK